MRKSIGIFALLLVLSMALSGCSLRISNVDDLMHPPKLSGESAGIQEAFERSTANKNVKMKTPTTGEYRSSYVLFDIDADDEQEVITFYSNAADETTVYMHVLDFNGTRWESVADIKGKGSEVYKIEFCDMNADGRMEIAVCWSLFESKGNKMLTIYTPQETKDGWSVRELFGEPFVQMVHADLNQDSRDEVLLLLDASENGINQTVCKLLAMDDDFGIYALSSLKIVPALSILSLQCQQQSAERNLPPLIYADCIINETTAITEIIYWDNMQKRLCAPLSADNVSTAPKTARPATLSCFDIDGDGVLEIPTQKAAPDAVTLIGEEEQPLPRTIWLAFDGNTLAEKQSGIMLYNSSYMFAFSEEQAKTMAVVHSVSERTCYFFHRNKDGTRGALLFEIMTVPTIEWEHKAQSGYTVLAESRTLTYVYRIAPAGAEHGIGADYPETYFSIIQ